MLPSLALLLLLLPKPNRCWKALWVGVPLVVTLALLSLFWGPLGLGGAMDAPDWLFDVLRAVIFGLTAVWLLSPYFSRRNRFLAFLGMLAVMELFSLFTCATAQPWAGDQGPGEMLIAMAMFGLVLTLAINLSGWSCRKRYSWIRFLLWLLIWIVAGWLVSFVAICLTAGPGPVPEMAAALAKVSGLAFGLVLPFLVLSFANAFYRARLYEALRLAEASLPSTPPSAP